MFLKNKNIIFKIRRSKVTDYAALKTEEMTGESLSTVLRIRRENIGVTKEIKLIKIEKRYCKGRKFNKNKKNNNYD